MNEPAPDHLPRSPHLLSRDDSALVVVDVQDKLLQLIKGHQRIVWNVRRLIDAAGVFNIPVVATEQYPKGLGPTNAELASRLGDIAEKVRFSCGGCPAIFEGMRERGIHKLVIAGIETHVCVLQTALDLLTAGFDVYLPVGAVGARFRMDHRIGLRRMETLGAQLTTTESAMFEWCEAAGSPEFKSISALVREEGPETYDWRQHRRSRDRD